MQKTTFLILIISTISISSCKNSLDETPYQKPPSLIVNNPRSANAADNAKIANMGVLSFKDTLHDFGNIKQGDVVEYDFEYSNTGKSDVVITQAQASCGCTVPDYNTDPIAPSKSAMMKVKFNSDGKNGFQHKTVLVKNTGNPGEITLQINAVVQ